MSSVVKRFRDNERLQNRFRCLAGWSAVLAAVLAVVLLNFLLVGGTDGVAKEFGRAAVPFIVASVAAYYSLRFAGSGFALLVPFALIAALLLAVCVWILISPRTNAHAPAAHISDAEADAVLDRLCDPKFRALPVVQQVEVLSRLSPKFRALDSVERAKFLLYPGFQPANCSSLAPASPRPGGRTATGSDFYWGLALGLILAAAIAYAVWRAATAGSRQPCAPRAADSSAAAALRQNLRLKVLYDEAKIDRLIDFEREQNPRAPLEELMRAAIERWERDNR